MADASDQASLSVSSANSGLPPVRWCSVAASSLPSIPGSSIVSINRARSSAFSGSSTTGTTRPAAMSCWTQCCVCCDCGVGRIEKITRQRSRSSSSRACCSSSMLASSAKCRSSRMKVVPFGHAVRSRCFTACIGVALRCGPVEGPVAAYSGSTRARSVRISLGKPSTTVGWQALHQAAQAPGERGVGSDRVARTADPDHRGFGLARQRLQQPRLAHAGLADQRDDAVLVEDLPDPDEARPHGRPAGVVAPGSRGIGRDAARSSPRGSACSIVRRRVRLAASGRVPTSSFKRRSSRSKASRAAARSPRR